jgi:dTDP-4-dehydrorhamnose reductase
LVHPLIVIGSNGFIGRHFCRAFPESLAIGRSDLDLCQPEIHCSTHWRRFALIAAGVGNPKKCESDPQHTYHCNVDGPISLGKQLSERGIVPIFFSTDYVFDDSLKVAPLNAYGRQKAELEAKVSHMDALVIRLSKVYGVEKGDGTLFDEMAATLVRGEYVQAARDQIFAPIYVADVIHQTMACLKAGQRGIVTLVGPRFASRLEMAKKVAAELHVDDLVRDISLDDLNDGVCRPKLLKLTSNFPALSWEDGIQRVVKAYAQ